eukprot:TRINITY_DN4886_c0_g1_i5.p1 TRINITY_DN4886_c0_g1~~TRINITY_DN4886_c0_g1_i5.p1  ORF type:complete len:744 (+),score=122.13 TRINITY_DN4886_c0_g1_i5:55-2286(+)
MKSQSKPSSNLNVSDLHNSQNDGVMGSSMATISIDQAIDSSLDFGQTSESPPTPKNQTRPSPSNFLTLPKQDFVPKQPNPAFSSSQKTEKYSSIGPSDPTSIPNAVDSPERPQTTKDGTSIQKPGIVREQTVQDAIQTSVKIMIDDIKWAHFISSLKWYPKIAAVISSGMLVNSFFLHNNSLFPYGLSVLVAILGVIPSYFINVINYRNQSIMKVEIILFLQGLLLSTSMMIFGMFHTEENSPQTASVIAIVAQSSLSYPWFKTKYYQISFFIASDLIYLVILASAQGFDSDNALAILSVLLGSCLLYLRVVDRQVFEALFDAEFEKVASTSKQTRVIIKRLVRQASVATELISPLETAIKRINEMKLLLDEPQVSEKLDDVIKLLGKVDLHAPAAFLDSPAIQNVDSQTRDWLRTEFRNPNALQDNYQMISRRRDRAQSFQRQKSNLLRVQDLNEFLSSIPPLVTEALDDLMSDWNADIFLLAEVTNGRPLLYTAAAVVSKFELLDNLGLNVQKFLAFVGEIESGYQTNPYHSSTHAADVLLNVYHLLNTEKIIQSLTHLDLLSIFLAAIVHDYAHPATTNNYHIMTQSPFALIYNDKSILENYHVSKAYQVLTSEKNNFIKDLDVEEQRLVRETVISLVLSTDMSLHFEHVNQFKAKIAADKLDLSKRENKLLLLQMAIKCSDLAHMSKCLPLHLRWSIGVTNEFYNQGDEEERHGLPRSPFMNRHEEQLPRSQIGFVSVR